MSCSCNPTFVYVMPLLKGVHNHIVLAITMLSQKANTRLRDTAHWLLPDVKASSRNPVCLMADEFCTPPQHRSAETRRETYVMSPFDLYSRNNLVMFPPPLASAPRRQRERSSRQWRRRRRRRMKCYPGGFLKGVVVDSRPSVREGSISQLRSRREMQIFRQTERLCTHVGMHAEAQSRLLSLHRNVNF